MIVVGFCLETDILSHPASHPTGDETKSTWKKEKSYSRGSSRDRTNQGCPSRPVQISTPGGWTVPSHSNLPTRKLPSRPVLSGNFPSTVVVTANFSAAVTHSRCSNGPLMCIVLRVSTIPSCPSRAGGEGAKTLYVSLLLCCFILQYAVPRPPVAITRLPQLVVYHLLLTVVRCVSYMKCEPLMFRRFRVILSTVNICERKSNEYMNDKMCT